MTTRDEAGDRLLLSLVLPPDPSSVGTARRRLTAALAGLDLSRPQLAEDAVLVLSELVTNALLHAGSDITVTASYDDHRLLVQVGDASPHRPRPRRYGEEARTGRGLHLVESVVDEWGVTRHATGKTVWVRWSHLDQAPRAVPASSPDGFEAAPVGGDTVEVVFLELPLLLHSAWREHVQALLRDYLLASLGDGDDGEDGDLDALGPIQTHAEVTDAISVIDEHLPRWWVPVDGDEGLATSVEPDVTAPRVAVPVPRGSVGHFATLDRAAEDALRLAAAGELLTPPTLPEVREFRRWVCRQVSDQAAGRPPVAFRVPLEDAFTVPVPDGRDWDERAVTEATTGVIAADTRSRIVALSRPAADLLGYDDPAELVGSRLVTIIPRRLRQAHVAGMTMYLLTDRRPLIDVPVQVPALRRDGSEVLVDLLLREQPLPGERPLLVARISPAT